MKKKVKLFSTIASLCLAVALMAFGVWAASNANFGVTSTVKYTLSGQVQATFTVKVFYNKTVVKTSMEDNKQGEYTSGYTNKPVSAENADEVYNEWSYKQEAGKVGYNLTESDVIKLGNYTFKPNAVAKDGENAGSTVTYVIEVVNESTTEALKVTLTNLPATYVEGDAIKNTPAADNTALETGKFATIEKNNGKFTYKVTYELVNATKEGQCTFNPSVALEAVVATSGD